MPSKSERHLERELLDAVIMRDISLVPKLLKRGADVNASDEEHGETLVMLAAKFADTTMARLLLDAGAQVDTGDDMGRTALFFAPVSSDVFGVLLDAGADVHVKDKEGNSILMSKVSESGSLADVEELLRLGVDPSIPNKDGETALDIAESLGLLTIAQRLKAAIAYQQL